MLKVYIHGGPLSGATEPNRLAVLDVAYTQLRDIASYVAVLSLKDVGAISPAFVLNYPRWAGSIFDLVARALTQCLYRRDQPFAFGAVAKRPAFADAVCAIVEKWDNRGQRGKVLGTVEIRRHKRSRTQYTAQLEEDILGRHKATVFTYGPEVLNGADLVLRSICWTLHKCETLGPKPAPFVPALRDKGGVPHIALWDLPEPAKTGLIRHLGMPVHRQLRLPTPEPVLVPAETYIAFLEAA